MSIKTYFRISFQLKHGDQLPVGNSMYYSVICQDNWSVHKYLTGAKAAALFKLQLCGAFLENDSRKRRL